MLYAVILSEHAADTTMCMTRRGFCEIRSLGSALLTYFQTGVYLNPAFIQGNIVSLMFP